MKQKKIIKIAVFLAMIPAVTVSAATMAGIKPGSVVIYSDGSVEKLLSRNKKWSLWQDQRKRQYKRSYLPYFPVLEYRRFSEQPSGYDQSVPDIDAVRLKPFSNEESVRFSLLRNDLQKGTSQRNWRCAYIGTGSYTLTKQQVTTDEYQCLRSVVDKRYIEKIREKIDLSYSSELNLVVQERSTDRYGKEKAVAVEKILPPEAATAKRIGRVVYKLTNR